MTTAFDLPLDTHTRALVDTLQQHLRNERGDLLTAAHIHLRSIAPLMSQTTQHAVASRAVSGISGLGALDHCSSFVRAIWLYAVHLCSPPRRTVSSSLPSQAVRLVCTMSNLLLVHRCLPRFRLILQLLVQLMQDYSQAECQLCLPNTLSMCAEH